MTDDVITVLRKIAEQPQPPAAIDLNETARRGRSRIRRRRILNGTAGLAVAAALATVGWFVWPGGQATTTTPASPDALVRAAAEHLALLESAQEPGDELPPGQRVDLGLIDSSVRAMPTSLSSTRFWVGVDTSGQLCLIGVPASDDLAWAASSCEQPAEFARHGVRLVVSGPAHHQEALLVPDGYGLEADLEWTWVAQSLAIRSGGTCEVSVEPRVLPDGSQAQSGVLAYGLPDEVDIPAYDYDHVSYWPGSDHGGIQVVQVRGDPLGIASLESDGLTVRGGEARLATIADTGQIAIWFEYGGCDYTIWVGPGLTVDEARDYAAAF